MSTGKSIGIVKLPRRARSGIDVLPWATEVNQCLQQLRDRAVTFKKSKAVLQTVIKPLTIKQGSASDKFQIVPGVVNGEMPTLGGITLDATTTPESTITESVYYWIKVVGTFATPLDTYVVTIEAVTTDGVPSGTDITATGFVSFYYIGEVDVDTSTDPDSYTITNQHSGGNLGVDSWGLYNIWWRS